MSEIWQRFNRFATAKPSRPRATAVAFVLAVESAVAGGVWVGIHAITH